MKLITRDAAKALIPAYNHSAETGESAKVIAVKLFTPDANCTWYITEGFPLDVDGEPLDQDKARELTESGGADPDKYDWHLYGWCDLGMPECAELGYVQLSEIRQQRGPFGLQIERDRYFDGYEIDLDAVRERYQHAIFGE